MSLQNHQTPYDARVVANAMLDAGDEVGSPLSVMKLLKLLYFAYGWYLVSAGTPLFHNPIEAWKRGPVVRAVWAEFRGQQDRITSRAKILNLNTGVREVPRDRVPPELFEFLRQILKGYDSYTALELSAMTHERDTPWSTVWHSLDQSANLGARITDEEIRNYFLRYPNQSILS